MSWPLSQDYNEAVQSPQTSFSDTDLQGGQASCNALGIPLPRSGNFADVYEFRCPGGQRWAVKCFTREVAGLRERYQEVSRHLQHAALPFTVDFTFLERGIRVGGRWYPILKMQWVEGLTLNEFVRQYVDKPDKLEALLQIWVRMSGRLRSAGIAHGDLQHGNLLLVPGSTSNALAAKLIDYDGMFVPSLAGQTSGEVGHPCYQHPQRLRERVYGPEVDRFPFLLIAASLCSLQTGGRALWEKHDSGDNLLFREADLLSPVKSPLFYELLKLDNARSRRLVEHTLEALRGDLSRTPLLDDMAELQARPKAAATTRGERPLIRRSRRPRKRSRFAAVLVAGLALLVLVGGSLLWTFHLRSALDLDDESATPVARNEPKPPPPHPAENEKVVPPKRDPPRKDKPAPPRDDKPPSLPDKPLGKINGSISSSPGKTVEPLPPVKRGDPLRKQPTGPLVQKPPDPPPAKPREPQIDDKIQNSLGMKLTYIPAGKFLMGTSDEEMEQYRLLPNRGYDPGSKELKEEIPKHEVRLTKSFYLGVYEVTQSEYEKVMGKNPSEFKGPSLPVDSVTWDNAMMFCTKLSESPDEKKAGRSYRLPTEAEWEYACRADTTTAFNCGDSLTFENANIDSASPFGDGSVPKKKSIDKKTVEVGMYQANAWGLYDMHGNVWEWCLDGPRKYTSDAVKDPHGPESDRHRVLRGGSWHDGAVRSAFREIHGAANYRVNVCGLRVLCEMKPR